MSFALRSDSFFMNLNPSIFYSFKLKICVIGEICEKFLHAKLYYNTLYCKVAKRNQQVDLMKRTLNSYIDIKKPPVARRFSNIYIEINYFLSSSKNSS